MPYRCFRFGNAAPERRIVALPLILRVLAMLPTDLEYYRARTIEEREQALAADRQDIAEIHLELARLYDALVNEPAIRPTLSISTPKMVASG